MSPRNVTRREFTVQSVLTMLSGVVVTVSGCGDSDSSTTPSGTAATTTAPAPGDVAGEISSNHGHRAVITAGEIRDAEMVSLDISGNAGHPHTVDLSVDDLMAIGNGARVSKRSSTLMPEDRLYPDVAQHSHLVTFN